MRQIQLIVLSAIFVVLCVIALQLARIASDFQLGADIRASVLSLAAPRPAVQETRAKRIDRLAREHNKLSDDLKAGFQENRDIEVRAMQLRAEQARQSR